jgi:hypothetical protein
VSLTGFNITGYDYISYSYVASGNGAGKIETMVFKSGGSGGSVIATLTFSYNGDDTLNTVTKT